MDRVSQPIIRGFASGTEHDSVVVLTTFAAGKRVALCTATLVAPNLIVTARHCVSNTDGATACKQDGTAVTGGNISGTRDASTLAIFAGKDGVVPDTNVEANSVAHGKLVIVDASENVCNHDMAFVVLDKDVAAPVSPIRLGAPDVAEKVAAVGWGVDETGNLVTKRAIRSDIALTGVGPAPHPGNAAWGYGDREFMTGESACAGDSGGPAFAKSGAIVGIAARTGNGKAGDGNYATTCVGDKAHTVYTHFGKYENLVKASFENAGKTMWLEGQPSPYTTIQATSSGEPGASSGSGPKVDPSQPGPAVGADAEDKGDVVVSGDESAPDAPATAPQSGGGCSMSSGSETPSDNVMYAAGLVTIVAFAFGLRRRVRKGSDEVSEALPPSCREPYESML